MWRVTNSYTDAYANANSYTDAYANSDTHTWTA
jgi:hypothetical protein